jgi:hypothetical protein
MLRAVARYRFAWYPRSGIVGSEYDRVSPGAKTPRGIEALTHSPVRCPRLSDSVYYTEPSGVGVFAAGTSRWVAALDLACPGVTTPAGSAYATAVKTRLLTATALGPLGLSYPGVTNLDALVEYTDDPIAARVNAGLTPHRSMAPGPGLPGIFSTSAQVR